MKVFVDENGDGFGGRRSKAAMISGYQIKQARMLLRWSYENLAEKAGRSLLSVVGAEQDKVSPSIQITVEILEDIQNALEAAGVEFTNGEQPGVRMGKG